MISIATMGKYWPQDSGGLVAFGGGSGSYSSFFDKRKIEPVVIVDQVYEETEEISIEIKGLYYDKS
jgi:hypothetical protein